MFTIESMATPIETALAWAAERGWSDADFARELGVHQANITNWKARGMPAGRHEAVAKLFGKTVDDLLAGTVYPTTSSTPPHAAESNIIALHADDPLPDGMVFIKEYRVRFSGGHGCTPTFDEIAESQPVPYLRSWLGRQGIQPGRAKRFKMKGVSMVPTIYPEDSILVNTAETTVVDGHVYAFQIDNDLLVKRLFRRIDGGLVLHSDNESHRPRDEELSPDQVRDQVTIIGRVRDRSGSGGL